MVFQMIDYSHGGQQNASAVACWIMVPFPSKSRKRTDNAEQILKGKIAVVFVNWKTQHAPTQQSHSRQ
jgi:hypothetical protein